MQVKRGKLPEFVGKNYLDYWEEPHGYLKQFH